jgi:hypothetical protein
MFVFVFNWTVCLMEPGQPVPPFGRIFIAFRIFCLLGTRVYAYLSGVLSVEQIGLLVMIVSGACHLIVFLFQDVAIRYVACLTFEACVGLYFPMIGTLKGDIVPENVRTTIYNIYRLPVNLIVLLPLLMDYRISTTFTVTTTILSIAAVSAFFLMSLPKISSERGVRRASLLRADGVQVQVNALSVEHRADGANLLVCFEQMD